MGGFMEQQIDFFKKKQLLPKRSGYTGIYATHKYWGKKPPEVCSRILDYFAEDGMTIMDPFMGSGVLARSCRDRKLSFVGADINPSAIAIAQIFVNPPSKQFVEHIFNKISAEVEQEIRYLYLGADGREATHVIREGLKVKEIWATEGRNSFLANPQNWKDKDDYNYENLESFDKKLFLNSRINVSENQTVASLFTPRALKGIDLILGAINRLEEYEKKVARYILTSSLGQMSRMVFGIKRRKKPKNPEDHRQYEVGSWVIGYWQPHLNFEINVWRVFAGRAKKLINAVVKDEIALSKASKSDHLFPTNIKIKQTDGFRMMSDFEENSIDLIITDPPHSDRIPYLELSEIWNSVLGQSPDYEKEWVLSNALKRDKNVRVFYKGIKLFMDYSYRILKPGGRLILIFNTSDQNLWNFLRETSNNCGLIYEGKFPAEYSARSVVQDSRKGALKHDWCLVFCKPGEKQESPQIPQWSEEWV